MYDIRVVVGIDFGTTYSGFAYSNTVIPEIETNEEWPPDGTIGKFKTNTVLMYDENGDKVKLWGNKALVNKKARGSKDIGPIRPIELFKLHLGRDIETSENLESRLNEVSTQNRINYKKAVADYLSEMAKFIMRECVFKAGLINELHSENLQLITESEATAMYCRKALGEHFEVPFGKSFLIVDCGRGTVNLTICRLLDDHSISLEEKTECSGDFCGGDFIDQEFAKFLGQKVGHNALKSFKENHYGRYQYIIHEFFHIEKHRFDGNESEFDAIDFHLEEYALILIDYITDDLLKSRLEVDEWQITLEFHHMKSFFDPVINRIIGLINKQLENVKECSAMFLVGGFCESRYLQNVIKKEFHDRVKNISVPCHPTLAVVKGAVEYGLNMKYVEYGLNMKCVKNRVLKNTYGVMLTVTRDTKVDVDEEFSVISTPLHPSSKTMSIEIFETLSRAPKFFDEPRMRQLEKIKVDLSENPNSNGASSSKIKAMAKVKGTGEIRQALINLGL
nr:741_t:CDS:2 [Entrophospora candida]